MATSGVVTYTVTESDIISDALQSLGVLAAGQTVSTDDTTFARRKLNMILKQMSAASDYFSGEKFWVRKTGYVFLAKSQAVYSLGPSGDHATSSYVRTTLAASAAAAATSITVASATGIANTYNIGIVLDSGVLFWTTVNGAPAGVTITLTAGLTTGASAGNTVFCYQTKMVRPLKLLTAVLRDTNTQDIPIDIYETLEEYESLADKTADADPYALYFSPTLTNSTISLNTEPADTTKVIRTVFRSPIEDMTASTDNFDVPQEFFRYVSAQLSMDCAPAYGVEIGPTLKLIRDESLAIARNAQPQTTNDFFMPGAD